MLATRKLSGPAVVFSAWLLTGCGPAKEAGKVDPPSESIDPARIVGIGRIEPELKILEINSQTSGVITGIGFQPGEKVSQGQIILELDSGVEKARIGQAAARIETQISQIKASEAALASVKIRMENAKIIFERIKTLLDEGAETQSGFDSAKAEYESLLEDTRRLEAEARSAEKLVREYRADRTLAQAEYEKRFITAPVDGRILSLDITLGSYISPQKSIGTFAPDSPLCAWCEIDELFAEYVEIGQKAFIRRQGTTEPLADGTVSFAGPHLRRKSIFSDEVGDLQDRRIREIRITLDPGADILIGSRVECVIIQ